MTERLARFLNILAMLYLAALSAMFVYAVVRYPSSANKVVAATVIAVIAGAIVLLVTALSKLDRQRRAKITVAVTAVVMTIYGLEILHPIDPLMPGFSLCILAPSQCPTSHRYVDGKPYRAFDKRTKLEILEDFREAGTTAYPVVAPSLMPTSFPARFSGADRHLFPLAGPSGALTIFANESGEYSIYQSDEHGFNNPKGLYGPGLDIVALGDSFAQGAAVQPGEDILSVIRTRFPRSLTLGMSGSGPLFELAIFREYVEPLQPRIVLWIFDEASDMADLRRERTSPLLRAYLDPRYRNGLIRCQTAIDRLLKQWLDREMQGARASAWRQRGQRAVETILLHRLRRSSNLVLGRQDEFSGDLFRDIISLANQSTSAWGGTLYFVYLGNARRVLAQQPDPLFPGDRETFERRDPFRRQEILQIVTESKIPIIDTYPELARHRDPRALLPFRGGPPVQHYNAEGYRLIAQTILRRLEQDRATGQVGSGRGSASVANERDCGASVTP